MPDFPYRVLLLGNYRPDGQMSMLRYHDLLLRELTARGVPVESIEPTPVIGTLPAGPLTKWLRYLDKYLFFPFFLKARLQFAKSQLVIGQTLLLHIIDHSNAPYVRCAPGLPVLATCHDLLAVRGALGEDTDCPASGFGKILQTHILDGLRRLRHIICVSSATQGDLTRLAPDVSSEVIPLALNQPYAILPAEEADRRLREHCPALVGQRFVLHVGSALRRKNREGILRIFARVLQADPAWPGSLVFAGEALNADQLALIRELGLAQRVVELRTPPGRVLEALYNRALCLLFPSKTEGFGWPIIEAQACGCPVLIARTTSLPEVAGDGALVCDFGDEAGFAEDLRKLADPTLRSELIAKGLANLARFETALVMDRYLAAYAVLESGSF